MSFFKKNLFFLLLLFGVSVGFFFFFNKSHRSLENFEKREIASSPLSSRSFRSALQPGPVKGGLLPSSFKDQEHPFEEEAPQKFSVSREVPSVRSVQEDLERDPHGPSQSLLKFAKKVGQQIEKLQNVSEAEDLLEDLKECALDPQSYTAGNVKAYCWSEIQVLGRLFPELKEKVTLLEPQVDATTRRIVEMIQVGLSPSRVDP